MFSLNHPFCTVGAIHTVPLKYNIYARIPRKSPKSVNVLNLCLMNNKKDMDLKCL